MPLSAPAEEVLLRVRGRRVFKPRIWIGTLLVRLGFWVMGAKAETAN